MMLTRRAGRRERDRNLPVPDAPRAPVNLRWLWWVAPPAALTVAYRAIPPRTRRLWNPAGNANSHLALAAILAGGGWSAFIRHAVSFEHGITEPNMWWLPQPGGK